MMRGRDIEYRKHLDGRMEEILAAFRQSWSSTATMEQARVCFLGRYQDWPTFIWAFIGEEAMVSLPNCLAIDWKGTENLLKQHRQIVEHNSYFFDLRRLQQAAE